MVYAYKWTFLHLYFENRSKILIIKWLIVKGALLVIFFLQQPYVNRGAPILRSWETCKFFLLIPLSVCC